MRFESYHPGILLLFYAAVIAAAVMFSQPVFVILGFLCAFASAAAEDLRRAVRGLLILLPLMALFAGFYAYYNHFGVTELGHNIIGNTMTLESLVCGASIALRTGTVCFWMLCVFSVMTADKLVYLLGRVSPMLSLFTAVLLRAVPRVRQRAHRAEQARRCVGRGIHQGPILRRIGSFLKEISTVISWTLDDLCTATDSMKCRGVTLRRRTAFSIYRFDARDRSVVIALCTGLTVLVMGILLDQTRMVFAPELRVSPVTPLSCVFYAAYVIVCLLPLGLTLAGEMRFRRQIRSAEI